MPRGAMQPHTRALVAAAAHALMTGTKVAGLYDHATDRYLKLAAEAMGEHLQGYDGDRDARFGGTLPELRDVRAGTSIHMVIEEGEARGYDRGSSGHFTVRTADRLVQLYDHSEAAWFAFEVQVA